MPSFTVDGSVAFVTGTNKQHGIGREIVDALLKKGCSKVYATARKVADIQDLVASYDDGKVIPVALDVTDLDAIAALPTLYPDVTIVVNNAGIVAGTSSIGDLDKIKMEILVNYMAPVAIGKAFSTLFAQVPKSSTDNDKLPTALVNINSIVSFVNFPAGGSYSASKAASHSITQAQRRDLPNTFVVGVYPGIIDTAMAEHVDEGIAKTPPSAVAKAIMDALDDGTEDVFPDPMAVQLHDGWKADAKGMEKYMAENY